jgi:hypothetical protein
MDTAQDPATAMDTAQDPATTMDTDKDLATIMDTDQCRVAMDTDHRPVTDAPLGQQPIRQTVMRLSRRRDRTCQRPLLVNDDKRACAGAISLLASRVRLDGTRQRTTARGIHRNRRAAEGR